MKKTRLFLMALLLISVLVFTACGSKDDNNDAIPDDQQNSVEQDVEDGIDDVEDDVEDGAKDLERTPKIWAMISKTASMTWKTT